MPLRIGVTGNIGSGKSTVCRMLEVLGIPVYYADQEARRLMVEDKELVSGITNLLGTQAYLPDGQLDRAFVASKVFKDKVTLTALNQLVHPAVAKDGATWHLLQTHVPYTLYEAALLYESGGAKKMDAVVLVCAPEKIRIARVTQRDQVRQEAVLARIKHQWPEEQKKSLADYIIMNDGSKSLIRQVWELHQSLIKKSKVIHAGNND